MVEQDKNLTGGEVDASRVQEWVQREGWISRFDSSGELPPGLVYNLEPDKARWHLRVSEDFVGDRGAQLVLLARFWGELSEAGRAQVKEAKKQAVSELGIDKEGEVEERMREILRQQAQERAREGNISPRAPQSPPSSKTRM